MSSDHEKNEPSELERAFNEQCKIFETEQEITEMKESLAIIPSEKILKKKELERLESKYRQQIDHRDNRGKKSPDQIISEMKKEGRQACEIAGELSAICGLSPYKIGELLPARPGTNIDSESVSRRGRKLLQIYRENNPSRENPE